MTVFMETVMATATGTPDIRRMIAKKLSLVVTSASGFSSGFSTGFGPPASADQAIIGIAKLQLGHILLLSVVAKGVSVLDLLTLFSRGIGAIATGIASLADSAIVHLKPVRIIGTALGVTNLNRTIFKGIHIITTGILLLIFYESLVHLTIHGPFPQFK